MLIVDEEENFVKQMRWALEFNYEILTASEESEARQIFADTTPAVVTLDLSLNQKNPDDLAGLRLLAEFLKQAPSTRVIIITGNKEESSAFAGGAFGSIRLLFQAGLPGRNQSHDPTSLSHPSIAATGAAKLPRFCRWVPRYHQQVKGDAGDFPIY
jgi:DNA-binding LacI/PurR family transcriptional regulator